MNKFVNWILGFILVVMSIMVCWLSVDLRKTTKELVEITNLENEIVFVDSIEYDTIFIERYDTIRLTKCQFDTITLNDTTIIIDSVDVLLPIELKHYNDTLSNTLISFDLRGYNCEVKDLYVQNLIVCPEQEKQAKQWYDNFGIGLGLQLGIGATKDGFSPYIGIGFSYNIFNF